MANWRGQRQAFSFVRLTVEDNYPSLFRHQSAFRPPQLDLTRARHIGASSGSSAMISASTATTLKHVSETLVSIGSERIHMGDVDGFVNIWVGVGLRIESPAVELSQSPWDYGATAAGTPALSLQDSIMFANMGGPFLTNDPSQPMPNPFNQRFYDLTLLGSAHELRWMKREDLAPVQRILSKSLPELPAHQLLRNAR